MKSRPSRATSKTASEFIYNKLTYVIIGMEYIRDIHYTLPNITLRMLYIILCERLPALCCEVGHSITPLLREGLA